MTTIRIPEPVVNPDLNRDGVVTFDELLKSSVWIALLAFVGVFVVGLAGTVWLMDKNWKAVAEIMVDWTLGSLVLAVLVGVGVGIYRQFRYEREQSIQGEAIRIQMEREQWELDQLKGVSGRAEKTKFTQAEIDAHAQIYLQGYYNGHGLTRAAWVKRGFSKDMWDVVNKKMRSRGIRTGSKPDLNYPDFAGAWGRWCEEKVRRREFWHDSGEYVEKR
jgi:hypothetical protein